MNAQLPLKPRQALPLPPPPVVALLRREQEQKQEVLVELKGHRGVVEGGAGAGGMVVGRNNSSTAWSGTEEGDSARSDNKLLPGGEENQVGEEPPEDGATKKGWEKRAIMGGLACVVCFLILDFTIPELGHTHQCLVDFLMWCEAHPAEGALAFCVVFVVASLLLVPVGLLVVGAGFVFAHALGMALGILVASICVLVGATVGALLSFLVGRYALKDSAARLYKKFPALTALDKCLQRDGFRLLLLLRLSPLIPYNILNYALSAVPHLSFSDYARSMIGIVPGAIAFVALGATSSSFAGTSAHGDDDDDDDDDDEDDDKDAMKDANNTLHIILITFGVTATVLAVGAVSYYSKRALREILENEEEELEQDAVESGREQQERHTDLERWPDTLYGNPSIPACGSRASVGSQPTLITTGAASPPTNVGYV